MALSILVCFAYLHQLSSMYGIKSFFEIDVENDFFSVVALNSLYESINHESLLSARMCAVVDLISVLFR